MTDDQKKLAEDNHNLIYSILKDMNLDIEDNYGLAAIGLCEAAIAFNPDRKLKFSTLAYKCMRNRILQDIRKSKMAKRTGTVLYFDQEIDDNGNTLFGTIPAKEIIEDQVSTRNTIRKIFSETDPRNRKIYYLLGQGYTQQEVATRVNLSQSYVSRIQKAAKLAG